MAGLGFLSGGVGSGALAVSSDGAVIVGSGDHGGTSSEASRWTQAGGMVGLGYLAGDDYSQAYGVSGDGSVVGGTSGSGTTNTSQAFRWENNAMTGLGYLPGHASNNSATAGISADGSVIVGYSNTTAGALEAFRWTQGTGMVGLGHIPLFSGIQSGAMAVSADGTVVVGNDLNPTIAQAFRWTAGGGMVGLGFYGPEDGYGSSYANAVTADGSVVVGQGTPDGMNMAAFIWDAVNGTRNLQDVLLSGYGLAPPTGWTLETANGISADGLVITGMMYDADYNELGWVADLSSSSAAVPEPTSMLLVASAMGWLAWMRRRKAV
jgi:probable HAF family extracellular repeat protein